ncbi:nuclear transport factor 2 family protein [Pontibacter sp. G13]|uniref:nuclear transport factor 2 family protein n=1 Tax=Pontibacter sp. G13 TaxID=3074898 RepID=UPI002889DC84|nr:nuclear transport factor 2 family protein [Pontibacter sp. G13]WNJ19819.1 nuclear transport factor 2 family protein [Pontibacter sp. G13]
MRTHTINFDALKKEDWSEKELANAQVATDFIQHIMIDHDFDYVLNQFGENNYVQHNRNIPDGMKELVNYVRNMAKRFPDYTYDVKHMMADGDYITFHSHATVNKKHRGNDKKGFNIMDTWKIVDGEIREHWDSIQPLDASMRLFMLISGGSIRNSNGVF